MRGSLHAVRIASGVPIAVILVNLEPPRGDVPRLGFIHGFFLDEDRDCRGRLEKTADEQHQQIRHQQEQPRLMGDREPMPVEVVAGEAVSK